jgi:hypothetical protein
MIQACKVCVAGLLILKCYQLLSFAAEDRVCVSCLDSQLGLLLGNDASQVMSYQLMFMFCILKTYM